MIAKIYIEKGAKTNRVGGEEWTNPCKNCRHNKNFRGACPKRERNGKNSARIGQDQMSPLFYPTWEHTLYGVGETKWRCAILTLISFYTKRETCPLSFYPGLVEG
jgi:hypothetical protein